MLSLEGHRDCLTPSKRIPMQGDFHLSKVPKSFESVRKTAPAFGAAKG